MKVKFFNSQCLYNKYADLIDTVLSEDLDIVAVCETWLDKSVSNSEFEINGYTHWSVIEHRTRKQDIEVGKYRT